LVRLLHAAVAEPGARPGPAEPPPRTSTEVLDLTDCAGAAPTPVPAAVVWPADPAATADLIRQLVDRHAPGGLRTRRLDGLECLPLPDGGLEHGCTARLREGEVIDRLEEFCQTWRADWVSAGRAEFVLRVPLPTSAGQRRRGFPDQVELAGELAP